MCECREGIKSTLGYAVSTESGIGKREPVWDSLEVVSDAEWVDDHVPPGR